MTEELEFLKKERATLLQQLKGARDQIDILITLKEGLEAEKEKLTRISQSGVEVNNKAVELLADGEDKIKVLTAKLDARDDRIRSLENRVATMLSNSGMTGEKWRYVDYLYGRPDQKIDAIKMIRIISGLGLKEAIDEWEKHHKMNFRQDICLDTTASVMDGEI